MRSLFQERWPDEYSRYWREGAAIENNPMGADTYAEGMMLAVRIDALRREADFGGDDRALLLKTYSLLMLVAQKMLPFASASPASASAPAPSLPTASPPAPSPQGDDSPP